MVWEIPSFLRVATSGREGNNNHNHHLQQQAATITSNGGVHHPSSSAPAGKRLRQDQTNRNDDRGDEHADRQARNNNEISPQHSIR
mmetsp:Transcript_16549/g.41488  ORF Transcript_16549/g.41488 Transcript_16549/m.41488 type:complete len:86 (-) Transcript_16549:84-341(-)